MAKLISSVIFHYIYAGFERHQKYIEENLRSFIVMARFVALSVSLKKSTEYCSIQEKKYSDITSIFL